MTMFDRIKGAYTALTTSPAAPTAEVKSSAGLQAAMLYRVGIEQYPPPEYRKLLGLYRRNPIVRACVKRVSEAVAGIEPTIKINGVENHRIVEGIARRLNKPNPTQDRSGLIRDLAAYYALKGDAFVEFVPGMSSRDPEGGYSEFYALRPDWMTITPGKDGWPARYTYRPPGGGVKEWDVQIERGRAKILHVKDFAPDDELWGRGGLEASAQAVEVYEQAYDLARAMFKNGAVPSGALVYDPAVAAGQPTPRLDENQYQRLKQSIEERFSGPKNAGRPLLLDGGLKWQPFSMNMVDLQAQEVRFSASRDIALAFGVPPMLLGIPGDSTYANFSEANRALYRQTALPIATLIYGSLATWFSRLLNVDGLTIEIDVDKVWALADEIAITRQSADASPSLTPNEKRAVWGYEPVTDGDVMMTWASLTPLSTVVHADKRQEAELAALLGRPNEQPKPEAAPFGLDQAPFLPGHQ